MKIFAIMLVKDEVDIVGYVLKEAAKWADKIFILDNGSTDGTWELVQSMKNDIITPWKQYFGEYHNGLRADVYNEFKYLSEPGDWWCFKLDADEFYVDNPKEFLQKIPKSYQMVGKLSIDYVITKEDVAEYNFTGDFLKDKEHIKYFRVPLFCEGRFFRYRKGLRWTCDKKNHYPEHIGVQADDLIMLRHYRDRSPEQIKKRHELRTQTQVYKEGLSWESFSQWNPGDYPVRSQYTLDENFSVDYFRTLPVNYGAGYKKSKLKDFIKRFLIALHLYN